MQASRGLFGPGATRLMAGLALLLTAATDGGAVETQYIRLGPLAGRPTMGDEAEVVDLFDFSPSVPSMFGLALNAVSATPDLGLFPVPVLPDFTTAVPPAIGGTLQIDSVSADFDGDGAEETVAAWEVANRGIAVVFFETTPGPGEGTFAVDSVATGAAGDPRLHPSSNPWAGVRHERVLHVAAGQLDRDAEEEVVVAWWSENGAVQFLVYDATDGSVPGEPVALTAGPEEALIGNLRYDIFDVSVGDFDGDLVDEIVLVLPRELVEIGGFPAAGLVAVVNAYEYDPDDASGPTIHRRGGGEVTIVSGVYDSSFIFLDQIVATPVDLAAREGFGGFVGVRPDWLAIAFGYSFAHREEPGGEDWHNDTWQVGTVVATLAFDRGERCEGAGPRDFCLAWQPDLYEAAIGRSEGHFSYDYEGPFVLPTPPPAALCMQAGNLSGSPYEELVLFRHEAIAVFAGGGGENGGVLTPISAKGRSLFAGSEFFPLSSTCDLAVTDIDASASSSAWRSEIILALQQIGVQDAQSILEHPWYQGFRPRWLYVDVWAPVLDDQTGTITDLSLVSTRASLAEFTPDGWGWAWAPRPRSTAAGDLNGNRVRLGEPARTSRTVYQPLVVLGAAPIHFDVLDGSPVDLNGCFQGSGCPFTSTYLRQTGLDVTVASEFTADWKTAVGGGLGGLIGLTLEKTQGERFSLYEGASTRVEVTVEREIANFDQVMAAEVGYELWEYPVFDTLGGGQKGYVSAILPLTDGSRTRWLLHTDRDLRYFAPDHEPGNLLSYRGAADLPASTNAELRVGRHATTRQPIVPLSTFSWSLATWTQEDTESSTGTISRTSSSGSISIPIFDIGDFGLSGSYEEGFETTETTARMTEDLLDLTVEMSDVPSSDLRYDVTPVVSWDPSGAVVLDFAIDFPAAETPFFQDNYGGVSDPAVSLPHLWDVEKGLSESTERRLETRDIELIPADPLPGDDVVLVARVHDYSLVDTPGPVNVKLYEGEPRFGRLIASQDTEGPILARQDAIVNMTPDEPWTLPAHADLESATVWMVIEPVGGYAQIRTENDMGWRPVSSLFVPEPGAGARAAAALLGLGLARRLRRRR